MHHLQLLTLLFLLVATSASAQNVWTPLPSVPIGYVDNILPCGENLFARSYQGAWRSTDDGRTWIPLVSYRTANSLAVSGDTVFLLLNHAEDSLVRYELKMSVDGGVTWSLVNSSLFPSWPDWNTWPGGETMIVRPGAIILLTTTGVARLVDRTGTWEHTFSTQSLKSIVEAGDNLFLIGDSVFRSTNDGETWDPFHEGIKLVGEHWLSVDGDRVYLSERRTDTLVIYSALSTDSGWVRVGEVKGADEAVVVRGLEMFAMSPSTNKNSRGYHHSTDGGATWAYVKATFTYPTPLHLSLVGNTLFAQCEYRAMYRANADSLDWELAHAAAMPGFGADKLEFVGDQVYGLSGIWGNPVFAATDNATRWRQEPVTIDVTKGARNIEGFGDTLFVSAGDLYRTTNHGATWTTSKSRYYCSTMEQHRGALYAAGDATLRSTDGGETWTTLSLGGNYYYPSALVDCGNALFFHVWLNGEDDVILRTLDEGATWEELPHLPTPSKDNFYTIVSSGNTLFGIATTGVFRWNDTDRMWLQVPGLTMPSWLSVANEDSAIAVKSGRMLYLSTDAGNTWYSQTHEPDTLRLVGLHNGMLYGYDYNRIGLCSMPIAGFGTPVASVGTTRQTEHALSITLAPNPTHDRARLTITTRRHDRLHIELQSIDGRHISTLVDEMREAGEHTIEVDGSSLASGTYLIVATSGGRQAAERMMVVR